jgi:hypothetical protein
VPVMQPNEGLDPVADDRVRACEQVRIHACFVTESRRSLITELTAVPSHAYPQRDVSCHADLGLGLAQRAWRERRLT